jgi:transposase
MAAERMSMRKIREVLRLHAEGLSGRRIGKSLSVSHVTVRGYLARAEQAGLSHASAAGLDDAELEQRLFPAAPPVGTPRPLPEWSRIQEELRKRGVTLQLLWHEYKAAHPGRLRYTQFVKHFRDWQSRSTSCCARSTRPARRSSSITRARPCPTWTVHTGEVRRRRSSSAPWARATTPTSEATESQSLPDWIGSHVRMYAWFGGVPEITVPDNLKAGVRQRASTSRT